MSVGMMTGSTVEDIGILLSTAETSCERLGEQNRTRARIEGKRGGGKGREGGREGGGKT